MNSPIPDDAGTPSPSEDPIFLNARLEVPPEFDPETEQLLPIVVGAHVRSELADRPLAERLARHIRAIRRRDDLSRDEGLFPIVVTDIWYLNTPDLLLQPAVVIGEPALNAASAHWSGRLPKAFVVDGSHQVLLDLEGPDRVACMWGMGAAGTEAATDRFEQRYLEPWLESVAAL